MEHKFEPFERVLVRSEDDDIWDISFFSYAAELNSIYKYCCLGTLYKYCIPYAGNEHLLGTMDSPEPKHEYKWGDKIEFLSPKGIWENAIYISNNGEHSHKIATKDTIGFCYANSIRPLKAGTSND